MDSEWLQTQFRLHPDKTKAALAQALGLDRPAISKILAGTRQIKAAEYAGMRRFFGLPVDGERAVHGKAVVLQPLTPGDRALADTDDADEEERWIMPARLFDRHTRAAPENIRLFTVEENAMAPDLMPGETVLVDSGDTVPSPPGIFVVSDGLGYIIRQCAHVPHSQPPQIRLTALNPRYETYTVPLAQARIIGRVIAKLQWL